MANKKLETFAKKFLLYFFGGLILIVILIVVFSDGSATTTNSTENAFEYTPCNCAEISYKIAKNGGISAASQSDNTKLEACNELILSSPSFSAKAKECPAYLQMENYFKTKF